MELALSGKNSETSPLFIYWTNILETSTNVPKIEIPR